MQPPSLSHLIRTFAKIGLLSFGGPVAQIGVMHRELVDRLGWLSEAQFTRALSFAMLLPGPEAMQLCTYAGWRLRGTLGGLIAGALFVLPGAVAMALITLAYLRWGDLPGVEPAFMGIKAAVIVVVATALARLARKVLTTWRARALALAAFIALALFSLPFPVVVLVAALTGAAFGSGTVEHVATPAPVGRSVRTAALWAFLWLAPLAILWLIGAEHLAQITAFFSRLAIFSFGGAYAALAWMAQALVETQGWLTPDQMVDGLGLAETTPGPLILVTQFAGMVAAAPMGTGAALGAGVLTLWAVFAPCFGLVFTLAPHLDRLAAHPRLAAGLSAVSAAVVGVIAALALYFARHFLFQNGQLTPGDLSWVAVGLTVLAAVFLTLLRLPLPLALVLLAGAGWLTGMVP
ncbi:MAG: chromate efflux transporter [Maritimibacter sp.]|uniref:chromate efflux transporter n=1 Tax=Maritimibacter sp. TaxID=2003363 RepID=UPI001DE9F6AB|nr:chromate efflux transporter [Maritimibacter sp.]MBL6425939.1 chromate efflux transporter [Maritimibacter sp.]